MNSYILSPIRKFLIDQPAHYRNHSLNRRHFRFFASLILPRCVSQGEMMAQRILHVHFAASFPRNSKRFLKKFSFRKSLFLKTVKFVQNIKQHKPVAKAHLNKFIEQIMTTETQRKGFIFSICFFLFSIMQKTFSKNFQIKQFSFLGSFATVFFPIAT